MELTLSGAAPVFSIVNVLVPVAPATATAPKSVSLATLADAPLAMLLPPPCRSISGPGQSESKSQASNATLSRSLAPET